MNLSHRSYRKELLDGDNIPFDDIRQNMQELDFINCWLGGHRITVNAFENLLNSRKEISVCEIGCGGGDNLIAISNWCRKKKIQLQVTGIDIKAECIAFAESRHGITFPVNWIISDFSKVQFASKPDIIFSSLFCHHFTDEELLLQFQWMKDNSSIGFFINDLHRHPLAYHAIKMLTTLFSSSYLVKHDAPLSVARGFKKDELNKLCVDAGISNAEILWQWAFRYLITWKHGA